MSSVISPIGPEPPVVYWIRRGVIVVILVVLLVGLFWMFSALTSGGGGAADPRSSASASDGATQDAGDPSADPTDASTDPAATPECRDSEITVDATSDASAYPVGSTPKLTLTITNNGKVACTRDVGPKANEIKITSGGYHVWSSDDCNAANKSKVTTLQPGDTAAAAITWNGRLSQKGCPDKVGDEAKPGRYVVVGRNGAVESDGSPFALTAS